MNNAERITKLSTKLGTIMTKRDQINQEYEDTRAELFTLLGGGDSIPATKTTSAKTAKTRSGSKLYARITAALDKTPGQTMQELAKRLGVDAQKISVSLWHLGRKQEVYKKEEGYFLAPTVPATKSIDLTEGTE